MKTEKKASEPSCAPAAVVKEEPDADRVKIKEESGSANTEDATTEDTTECPRDSSLDPANGENNMTSDNQNGSSSQPILNSVKQEDNNATDELTGDCPTNIGIPPEGVQPLVSNVLAKQMGTGASSGEAQYMQQQSQIFVFSTALANKAAEACMQGQYPSIIAYHCAQPGTKKYLEKHPNKGNQFRQNPAQWLNNLANLKQKGHQGGATFPTEQPPDLPPLDPHTPSFWDQHNMRNMNNMNGNSLGNPESSLDDPNIDVPCLVPNSPSNPAPTSQPQAIPNMGHSPRLLGSPGPGVVPSLQGVKVPDENLTPQQRQHREVQLATIRKMQMMLFPEDKEERVGSLDSSSGGPSSCPSSHAPPTTQPNQCQPGMEWHKLQQQFLDGKGKVGVGSPGGPIRGSGMVGGMPRSQGPPPPYHQTTRSASVPIATQSPNPSSPNNPTSNLSLPSPRASSALNSPADCNRQFQLGNQRSSHLPGQSPTSQDSPNPTAGTVNPSSSTRLNHSNPGTPVSHAHLAALSPGGATPQKDSSLDFPSTQPTNVDGMFCRTLQSLAQQKQQHSGTVNAAGVKEANLMPVPSPQQIQYLNTFEGQELTIQKQPNTSLKDGSLPTSTANSNTDIPNRMLSGSMESSNQFSSRTDVVSPSMESASRGFSGSLHSPHTPHTPHTPGSVAPHTPVDSSKLSNKTTASAQSSPAPHNPNLQDSMGPPRTIPASPNTKSETSPPSQKDLQQQQQQQIQQQQQQQHQQQQQQQQQQNQGNPNNQGLPPSMIGPGVSFPCSRPNVNVSQPDNVPLNPNNMGVRLGGLGTMSTNHFDPITSLAQMSQQLTNTAASNALGNDGGPMHSGNQGMMPFGNPHGMHMMQMQGGGELNGGCHMPGPTSEAGDVSGMCMGLGGPSTSYSPTPHTGSPGVPNKMSHHHSMMAHGMMGGPGGNQGGGPHNPNVGPQGGPYPGGGGGVGENPHGPPSRLMSGGHNHPHSHGPHSHGHSHVHVSGPNPYNGANVQVKPSAPNTIQYLPARPNVSHAPRGPPSLEFLQRFTSPLDNKMNSPSANIHYFPNGCVPNNMGPHQGMPGNMVPHSVQQGLPPGMGGSPRMDGQTMNSQVGMHSMRPVGGAVRQQPIMRMQHMVGGGVFPGSPMDPDKVFPPDMVPGPQMPGQNNNPGMYGPGNKGGPMGLGPPPDATQPLPPSMGGGSSNFKNSPFVGGGPSMSDPNYAQQFHNFQQQLYATGTRGSGPPPHPNMHPQPNSHSHQQFFMPK